MQTPRACCSARMPARLDVTVSGFSAHVVVDEPSLVALSRAEFIWAKQLASAAWKIDCASAGLALLTCMMSSPAVVVTLAVLSVLSMVTGRILTYMRKTRYQTAERARRALLVIDGHDLQLNPAEQAQLEAQFSRTARRRASIAYAPPYLKIGRPGAWRLRILVQKDAFWTANLCREAAKAYHPLVIGYPLVLLVLVVTLAVSGTHDQAVVISRIVALAVALWLGREGLSAYLSLCRAAAQAESIDKVLEGKPVGAALDAVLPSLRDYDVVVAGLPSIPESVRERHRERLQRIWQNRVLGYWQ